MTNNIGKLRAEKKLTLQALSEKTGIQKGTLASYESKGVVPRKDKLSILAQFFNVSESYLLGLSIFRNDEELLKEMSKKAKPTFTGGEVEKLVDSAEPYQEYLFHRKENLKYLLERLNDNNLPYDNKSNFLALFIDAICTIFSRFEHDEKLLEHTHEIILPLLQLSSSKFKADKFAEVLGESSIAYVELFEYIKNKDTKEDV